MAKILVYNEDTNRIETYNLAENQPMPYNVGDTLRVSEFRGSSRSPTLWTSKKTMEAFNQQRRLWGNPIPVGFAFKRPWEGGHSEQSQHYNGSAFDVGQRLSNEQRNALRRAATESGLWSYVEPAWLTPTWVIGKSGNAIPKALKILGLHTSCKSKGSGNAALTDMVPDRLLKCKIDFYGVVLI